MAVEVKRRSGTTTQHSTFTGATAELTVDTTKKTVVVHDGSTVGGIPLAKESHSADHQSGGTYAIKLDDFATPDDNTDLNASTTRHGLLRKLDNDPTHYLDGQGNWINPKLDDLNTPDDNTDLNASTTRHGLQKKLDNDATHFMDGQGNYVRPFKYASAVLDFPSTLANSTSDLTITVSGAADGDPVSLGVPNASIVAGCMYFAWVSAADTVTVRFVNHTASAADPASGTFKVAVHKP